MPLFIGTAGWTIPGAHAADFPGQGSHLERYAAVFPAVEINSTFHRPHRESTFARWADSVPPGFRFSVKLPKAITHELRLAATDALLDEFLGQVRCLGDRLGCLLVQLPPSLEWNPAVAITFLDALRARHAGDVVVEPRHASWFMPEAEQALDEHRMTRVAADPSLAPGGGDPGGWKGLAYFRYHGFPRVYFSRYDAAFLLRASTRVRELQAAGVPCWCIFDNTAAGAATANALELRQLQRR